MESVDTETYGKRGGGTHFHLADAELFLDYQYFDNEQLAVLRIGKRALEAKRVLEEAKVLGKNGETVGKLLVGEFDSKYPNEQHCLLWTNENKFTEVCSESTRAIDEFRNSYEL